MGNTTNYGWNTPNSTDLISDWVANFLTTFNAVDSAVIRKAPPARGFASGKYVGANAYAVGASTSCDLRQNELSALPLYFDRDVTITNLAIQVTVAAASTTYRLGIFESANDLNALGFDWLPGQRVLDAGTVDGSTTGVKNISGLTQALTGGKVYWLAVARQGASTGTTQRIKGITSSTSTDTSLNFVGGSASPTSPFAPLANSFENPTYRPYERAPFVTGVSGAFTISQFASIASWSSTNLPLVLARIQ